MIFPDHLNFVADFDFLLWIAQQVPDHAYVAGIREFDQDNEIGAFVSERLCTGCHTRSNV